MDRVLRFASPMLPQFAEGISSECGFLDTAVNSCHFVGLYRGGLSMGQPCLYAALGKCPSIAACAHQKKFDTRAENPEANGGDLPAFWSFSGLQ